MGREKIFMIKHLHKILDDLIKIAKMKQKQEDWEFKVILRYIASLKLLLGT